ncbi:hypothetical protein ABEB36_010644 [Hypothenemus hampei]|uniref:Uncharacterized protein n=1 Tax=Hypothenemus hampei TaxID=57062 RepID=A0ABD1EEQ2_HYPHA
MVIQYLIRSDGYIKVLSNLLTELQKQNGDDNSNHLNQVTKGSIPEVRTPTSSFFITTFDLCVKVILPKRALTMFWNGRPHIYEYIHTIEI